MESTLVQSAVNEVMREAIDLPQVSGRERERLIDEANVPLRHRCADVVNVPEWTRVREKIVGLLASGCLVMLCGTRGSGKTQLGVEAIRELAKRGWSSRYATAMDVFIALKSTYQRDSRKTEAEVLREFTKPSLLVIDEVGKRSESDWENSLLFHIVDKRYGMLKDTILISNQTREAAIASVGASAASRMQETGGVIECNWKSFREVTR